MITKQFIAAAIIEQNGKILIAQRAKPDSNYGKWEFPGGKMEEGEALQECLKRELFEELNIHADIGEYFCTSSFYHNKTSFDMCAFKVSSFSGDIKLNEHSVMAWVTPTELSNYSFPEPDLPIVALLQERQTKTSAKTYFYFLKQQLYLLSAMAITYALFRYIAAAYFSVTSQSYTLEFIVAYAVTFIILGSYIRYRNHKKN